jgi:hypothetical protein
MTPQEWIAKLKALPQMVKDSRVLFFATKATMTQVAERVWGKGLLTNGSKLAYKEYELYAYKPPSPVKPTGKGKTGKKIKGGYYPNYEAYKAQQGRADLPFELTGDMRKAWLGGGVGEPKEKGPLNAVIEVDEVNAKKIEGLTKEKGEFLKFTQGEREAQARNIEAAYKELVLDRL